MFGCPLAHYLSGYPGFVAARLMYMSVWKRNNDWFNSAVFQELYKVISEDFSTVLEEGGNFIHKYGNKFDVFAVGMCLQGLKNPLSYDIINFNV